MTLSFFQKFWSVLANDIMAVISSFFHLGQLLTAINHTFISLIPKIPNPSLVSHYRPISLCNTLYKQILDNVMIAHDYLHFLNGKHKGNNRLMAIKLDMSKAYDKIE
ncbi:hypothetical protein ACH5RR_018112 [Cinchona calisaya]|uniref:Reverse transcriptase domain-containing protein n=1 Tax=Cinchona calisaya TaxID=153742 RepID=A0ABD2ZQK9_9GENT